MRQHFQCFLIFLSSVLATSCDLGMCENDIYQETISPDQRWKMVKFERGCGVGSGNSIQISLVRANKSLPDEPGNIFVANLNHGWDQRDTSVVASWVNNDVVEIRYERHLKLFEERRSYRGIQIRHIRK